MTSCLTLYNQNLKIVHKNKNTPTTVLFKDSINT